MVRDVATIVCVQFFLKKGHVHWVSLFISENMPFHLLDIQETYSSYLPHFNRDVLQHLRLLNRLSVNVLHMSVVMR